MRNCLLARLRFCFDAALMTSDTGLLLLAEHAASCGDIARIGTALAPKPGRVICGDEPANDAGVAANGLLQKGRVFLFKSCLGM